MNFKDALEEDLAVFTNSDEFGVQATFSRSGLVIDILLDNDIDVETGRFFDFVTVKLSDVVGVVPGDTFLVGLDNYMVVSKKPEPVGELMGMLRVEK